MTLTAQGKKITFMPELEVVHFKNYSFGSLVKNDFLVPFGFARSFWIFEGWRAYLPIPSKGKTKNFSHILPTQVYSLLIVMISLFAAYYFPWRVWSVFLAMYLILNLKFFHFLATAEGFMFALLSVLWTFVDQLVMLFGAICGLIYHGAYLLDQYFI